MKLLTVIVSQNDDHDIVGYITRRELTEYRLERENTEFEEDYYTHHPEEVEDW